MLDLAYKDMYDNKCIGSLYNCTSVLCTRRRLSKFGRGDKRLLFISLLITVQAFFLILQ